VPRFAAQGAQTLAFATAYRLNVFGFVFGLCIFKVANVY
jgi:hypothetical protein